MSAPAPELSRGRGYESLAGREADLQVALSRLHLLGEVSTLLAGSLDYEATLQRLAHLTVPALADMCVIDMLAGDGSIRRVAAAHVNPELSGLVATLQRRFPPDPKGSHPVATVLRTGRSEMAADITESVLADIAPDPQHRQIARALAYTSFIVVPLVARERTLGALSLVSGQSGRHYTATDLALAEELARRASLAVDNAQLYREAQHRRREAESIALQAERARSEAEAANRAKDHFLAMLAHELRNPLAPIRSGFYVIGQRLGDDPMVQRAREIIERQLTHLTRLLDDLLDVARITQGKIELLKVPVELGAAVAEAIEATRSVIDSRGHTIRLDLPDTPIRLEADPTRLVQIIANLLNNAAKYTPPRGTIALAAHQDAGWVVVSITDTGIGIPDEMLPRIFDLFAQVDPSPARSEGGLGIGLTLVRRLVELHGGDVSARSEGEGRGSEFLVRLPAGPVVARTSNARPASAFDSPRSVLVVEDNPDNAQMLQACLELAGHRVLVAGNGADAVTLAVRERPDVMLVDIGLPVFDGYEVARRVRAALGSAAVLVALTGYGQPQDRRQALEAGFDDHLVKPVDPEQLTVLIARAKR